MGLFLRIFIRVFFWRIFRIVIFSVFLYFSLCGFDTRIYFFKKEQACERKNRRQKHYINPDSDQTSDVKKSRKHAHCRGRVYFSDNSYNPNESKSERNNRCPTQRIRINAFIKFIFYDFNDFWLKKYTCKSKNEQGKNPKSVWTLCERS